MSLFLELNEDSVQSNTQIIVEEALEKQVFIINGDNPNNVQ